MTTALRLVEGSSMDKSKALDAALSQIERTFGKGSIMRLGKNDKSMDVETVSTGSLGLDIALRIGAIKERDEVVGNQTRVKVVKNKLAPPFKQVEFDIMYGEGVSKSGELIDLGVKAGVVEKSGTWFSYDSQRIGQGRENAKTFLRNNPDIAAKIEAAVRQNAGLIAEQILVGEESKDDD